MHSILRYIYIKENTIKYLIFSFNKNKCICKKLEVYLAEVKMR